MSTPSWMLVRLGLDTSVHHPQADSDRLAAMDAKTRAEYRAFLVRIFGFESAVETALARVKGLDQTLLRSRMKVGRLRDDLLALGLDAYEVATLPISRSVSLKSVPQALGWMFVVERHTLLAGLIRRHLMRAIPGEIRIASSYLTAYGGSPGAQFRAFGDALADYAQHYTPTSIIAAASEAFRAQRHWYLLASHAVRAPKQDDDTPIPATGS